MKFLQISTISILLLSLLACGDSTARADKNAVSDANDGVQTSEQKASKVVDLLIVNGTVYNGEKTVAQQVDVAICGRLICEIGANLDRKTAKKVLDAKQSIVSPGFIDPHTHSLAELESSDKNHNLNYLTQGVTTVVNGNDGEGPVNIGETATRLLKNGIGTNVGLFVGHGSVRFEVMGKTPTNASAAQLDSMKVLTTKAMQEGALGLSTGLYYVPGSYADTEEVIALAKIASSFGGIYDTHLRDESTFNIGFLHALEEAMEITKAADIHLHLAHIKALGVDVWGQSEQAIRLIENAQKTGHSISADQYPWLASGTKLHSAVMPKWAMADSTQAFHQRLKKPELKSRVDSEIAENIRRRGGPSSILITAFSDKNLVGLNLAQVAELQNLTAVQTAKDLVLAGEVRIASFNMSEQDVERFMTKPWVVTSSDGTNGHPRKYASFPKKYQTYVREKSLLSVGEFIQQSTSKTAEILGIKDRGKIKEGLIADVIIFDPALYAPKADFSSWNEYSEGVNTVILNGQLVIENSEYQHKLAGEFVRN